MKGAEGFDGGVLVGDAEICGVERNASGAVGNCGTKVGTAGVGKMDAGTGLGVDGTWRRRCARFVGAGLFDFGVFGAGAACLYFCTVGNASTMQGNCLSAGGNARIGDCGKKTLRGVELSGVGCWH